MMEWALKKIIHRIVILLPKFSDLLWGKIVLPIEKLEFEAEGQEFAKLLRSLEQYIQAVKGLKKFW